MANWRNNVKPPLRLHLDRVIKNSATYKDSIEQSDNKVAAQLWVSNALLSKELHEAKVRVKYLETTLIDLLEKQKKQTRNKKNKKDIDSIIKTLRKF